MQVQAVVIVFGVVGLWRVDDEQAGSPDELFGRGEERSVQAVVVVFGVVGLRTVDNEQSGSPDLRAFLFNDKTFQFQVHKTYHTNVPFFNNGKAWRIFKKAHLTNAYSHKVPSFGHEIV